MLSDMHVFGVHGGVPHWLGIPAPPHVWPEGQVPQSWTPPQPSDTGPQFAFACMQVCAVGHMPVLVVDPETAKPVWVDDIVVLPPMPVAEPVICVPPVPAPPVAPDDELLPAEHAVIAIPTTIVAKDPQAPTK
jgi:hypothetical protein